MPASRLDGLYRRMLITKFFEKGWGKPENLKKLFELRKIVSNRESCYKLVPPEYPVEITKEEKNNEFHIIEGKFLTPLELYLPGLVPKACQHAQFQMLLPLKWADENYKPVCVQFAGTGDHFYWKRRNFMAKPLLRESGIGSIILENPFYGVRKPDEQVRSNLNNVSDIIVMGACTILENLVLLHWCERNGLGPLGVTGLSMGGHLASLAATNWPKPLVLVPCLSWSTAAAVFTEGVMSQSINWKYLESQYFENREYSKSLSKMVKIIDDAFMAGQQFASHFNESMDELTHDIKTMDDVSKRIDMASNLALQHQKIMEENSLNLSEKLFAKMQSNEHVILTQDEISELHRKILFNQGRSDEEIESMTQQTTTKCVDLIPIEEKNTVALTTSEYVNDTIRVASNALTSALNAGTTKLMSYIMPQNDSNSQAIDTTKHKWWDREALQFMRGVMDECTHLKNFTVPYDTSLITAFCAKDDAYVPRDGCSSLEEIWPGADVKYLDAGHVSAYVLHQKMFRSSIAENFERAKEIYAKGNVVADVTKPTISYDELYERYRDYCERTARQPAESPATTTATTTVPRPAEIEYPN